MSETLKRNSKLINRKFITYLIPSILMIFAMAFGSLVDGILIGNMIGNEALSASSLVMPVLYIVQIPGFALGVGGSIIVSTLLGKRDIVGAKKAYSFCLIIGFAISIVIAAIAFPISKPLASLFGGGDATYIEYARQYVLIYLLTDPIVTYALIIGSIMAVDNSPRVSSIFYISSNIAKFGLEILFIKLFESSGNGMIGAALSTGGGYAVGLLFNIFYFVSKKRMLKFTFNIKNSGAKEIFKASSVAAFNLLLTAIQSFIVNIFIGKLLSESDLLLYGLISNMVFLFSLASGGVINTIPTFCGLFSGEKDYYSLKSVTRKIYWINIIITVVVSLFIIVFPNLYCGLFGYKYEGDLAHINTVLWIYLSGFIPYEINKFSTNYYPTVGKNLPSLLTIFLEELILILPLSLVLLHTNGLIGYCIAFSVNELLTLIIVYIFIYFYNKKKKYHGIFMLEKLDVESFDVSLDNKAHNASVVSTQIIEFAKEHNIPNRESQIVGLAAEEMVDNIIRYGYKKNSHNYIDVNLKLFKDTLLLRIRDDGVPFDPTKVSFDENEEYSTSGIKLIKSITDKVSYMRILNLNNTVFEINIKGV